MSPQKAKEIYLRHYPIIGVSGQEKIASSRVVVVGAGALGSYSVHYLHKLGVEKIRVIDCDTVEPSDIPRTIYSIEDVGYHKVDALEKKYEIEGIRAKLTRNNVDLLDGYDLIVDGTDNLRTRFLINEYAVKNSKPWIYMSVLKTYGYVMPIIPGVTACLRCFMSPMTKNILTTASAGIISYLPAFIATVGTSLAKKILLRERVESHLMYFDLENLEYSRIFVERKEYCPVCSKNSFEFLEGKYDIDVNQIGDSIHLVPRFEINIDLNLIYDSIRERVIEIDDNYVRFYLNSIEISIYRNGIMIAKGCDENTAMRLYERFIGF